MFFFPGDFPISVPVIHHKALNMQIVLISVLGDSKTYSNVPLYLNPPSFIFISLIQCWRCSSITTGTHADRWSQGTVIVWSHCLSSLVDVFFCAEKGDTGRRNKHTDIDAHSYTFNHIDTCSAPHKVLTSVHESGKDRPGTLILLIQ